MSINNIIKLNRLDSGLAFNIKKMIKKCEEHDFISYEIFMENEVNCSNINCFYIYMENNIIKGFMSLFMPSEDCLNVYGCTLPAYRHKGIFSKLFSSLIEETKKYNIPTNKITFPVNSDLPGYSNAILYLNKRHYTLKDSEYLFRCDLNNIHEYNHKKCFINDSFTRKLELEYEETENDNEYSLWINDTYIGGCLIYYSNNANLSSATIYEYGILDEYQGIGYGKTGLKLIIDSLKQKGISSVLLHASKSNNKACNLYLNCGFNIIDRIDYFSL